MNSKLRNRCNSNLIDTFDSSVSHGGAYNAVSNRAGSCKQLKAERPRLVIVQRCTLYGMYARCMLGIIANNL